MTVATLAPLRSFHLAPRERAFLAYLRDWGPWDPESGYLIPYATVRSLASMGFVRALESYRRKTGDIPVLKRVDLTALGRAAAAWDWATCYRGGRR